MPNLTFCTGCLREGLDPWSDTDEGYTHCCNKRLGYGLEELRELLNSDLDHAATQEERDAIMLRLGSLR